FVYSIRRGLSPELASRNAYLAYYIRYAQAYNEGAVFVRDPATQKFILEQDLGKEGTEATAQPISEKPLAAGEPEYKSTTKQAGSEADTDFHRFMHSPPRLTLPGEEKPRNKLL